MGCGALIEKGSRCRRCEAQRRGTSSQQATWRRRVLAASGGLSVACGGREGVEAHHLHPLAEGGDKNGAGVPLCSACHRFVHSKAAKQKA